MALSNMTLWSMGCAAALLCAATFTDLRWRRIPNYLTFPAIAIGLVLYLLTGGWKGLLLSLSGAIVAPSMLSLAHGGKGLGMGDIKLSMALGALLGPAVGAVAMLLSMIAGAGVAMIWMIKETGMFGHGTLSAVIGRVLSKEPASGGNKQENLGGLTIPYGVAIAIGTLTTLVICLWTGNENWFLWLVTVAETQ